MFDSMHVVLNVPQILVVSFQLSLDVLEFER